MQRNVIAIFLGQVNTNNLYNLVSKHSPAARREAAWHLIASLFHSGQSCLSTTPGHGNWATPSTESMQVIKKWNTFSFMLTIRPFNRIDNYINQPKITVEWDFSGDLKNKVSFNRVEFVIFQVFPWIKFWELDKSLTTQMWWLKDFVFVSHCFVGVLGKSQFIKLSHFFILPFI